MFPETDKEKKMVLKNSKLQLWGAAVLAGLFILVTKNVTSLMLIPIYTLSLYSTIRYTASNFMTSSKRLYYRKAAYLGLIAVLLVSIVASIANPVGQYREERRTSSYNNLPYEYQNQPTSITAPYRTRATP